MRRLPETVQAGPEFTAEAPPRHGPDSPGIRTEVSRPGAGPSVQAATAQRKPNKGCTGITAVPKRREGKRGKSHAARHSDSRAIALREQPTPVAQAVSIAPPPTPSSLSPRSFSVLIPTFHSPSGAVHQVPALLQRVRIYNTCPTQRKDKARAQLLGREARPNPPPNGAGKRKPVQPVLL